MSIGPAMRLRERSRERSRTRTFGVLSQVTVLPQGPRF